MSITVAAFSGSLRKESYTTKLVKAFQQLAPDGITVNLIPIGDLPFINQDLEDNLPAAVKSLHASIEKADAILLATPEYNRSYSPVFKKCVGLGFAAAGSKQMEWQTGRRYWVYTLCTGCVWRTAPSPPGIGLPEHVSRTAT